jgi:radical SAM protein with 4Fe4S-binding SPASM domain
MISQSQFWSKVRKLSDQYSITNAAIELTNRCNAQCSYCYIPDHTNANDLTTQQIHYIIDKLDSSGILFINLTGGDPFLRTDINEILDHHFSCNFFLSTIFTNGTNINQEHIKLLSRNRNKIKHVRMTVFSHFPEAHDSYMKINGSLTKIINTGKLLLDEGIRTSIAIPVMDFNVDYLNTTIAYFRERGFIIGLNTSKLITKTNNPENLKKMISEDFYLKFFRTLNDGELLRARHEINPDVTHSLCRGLRDSIMIDTKGDLHPCTNFREFTIGSIFQDCSISEILELNPDYKKLRTISKKSLVCNTCEYSKYCLPCLANKHLIDKNFDGPFHQSCNYTNALIRTCEERGI